MLSDLLARLNLTRQPPRPAAPVTGPMRLAICPPARARHGLGRDLRFVQWLISVAPRKQEPVPLWEIQLEFMRALQDIRTPQAYELLDRISIARSLRELWHLRAQVFDLVTHHHDQAEAHIRLESLNRHFPARGPSTGFGDLDPACHRKEFQ